MTEPPAGCAVRSKSLALRLFLFGISNAYPVLFEPLLLVKTKKTQTKTTPPPPNIYYYPPHFSQK